MNTKTIFMLGVIHGLSLWGTRALYQYYQIPFGTHTLLLALILFLLLWQVAKLNWFAALCGTLISFTLLLVGENFIMFPLIQRLQISFDLIMNNILWFYAAGLSSVVLLVLLVLFNWFRNRNA